MENKREYQLLKKQKRIILTVITILVLFVAVYYLITLIDFDKIFVKESVPGSNDSHKIYFYNEDLSKYPSQDETYMEYDQIITYENAIDGTVIGEAVLNKEAAINHGEAFYLLYNLVDYIRSGDHEAYNSCFSSKYFSDPNATVQGKFTKQKIYNIVITEISKVDKNGYTEYTFSMDYFIRHNNGSLRNDMGSDCSKTQYFVLSDSSGDGFLIDSMYTFNYEILSEREPISWVYILLIIIGAIALVVLICFGVSKIKISKKIKKESFDSDSETDKKPLDNDKS